LNSNPTVSYRRAFGICRQSLKSEKLSGNLFLPQATLEALAIFYCCGTRVRIKISPVEEMPVCPTGRFLQSPAKSAFKRLILETPLYQHMSSNPTSELTDAECEKGHVTQRPPILYATSKTESVLKASRETIKMKSAEGEVKVAVLGDSPGAEECLQHLNAFSRMLARKKLADDLQKCAKAVVTATAAVRKHSKVPNGEKTSEKAQRLSLLEPAEKELVAAKVAEAAKVTTVYELFHKGLRKIPNYNGIASWKTCTPGTHGRT
jgi:hypothetical protein